MSTTQTMMRYGKTLARTFVRDCNVPDPDGENDHRAMWAEKAVAKFVQETDSDFEDSICDLLTDLRHFCDRHGIDFSVELARADAHYKAETAKEPNLD